MPYAVTLIDIVEVDILNVAKEEDIDGGVDGGDIEAFFLLWSLVVTAAS